MRVSVSRINDLRIPFLKAMTDDDRRSNFWGNEVHKEYLLVGFTGQRHVVLTYYCWSLQSFLIVSIPD